MTRDKAPVSNHRNKNRIKSFISKFKAFLNQLRIKLQRATKFLAGAIHFGTKTLYAQRDAALHVEGNDLSTIQNHSELFTRHKKPPIFAAQVLINTLRLFVVVILIIIVAGAGLLTGFAKGYLITTPVLSINKLEKLNQATVVYDKNGDEIATYKGSENRIWANIDEIPIDLQHAFIAIEDERFYSHQGIDIKRLIAAIVSNLSNQGTPGGSTITQQLIKNRLLSFEQTYKRKIQEAYLAIQLENQYSKDQILEAYLNTIQLGNANYGVKAAAKDYFGKELKQLTLRECATLAGITRNPYGYDPRRNYHIRNTPERTDQRTNLVLKTMYENGFIKKETYDTALRDKIKVLPESKQQQLYEMPYFIEYAVSNAVTMLLKQSNLPNNAQNRAVMENRIRTGGYRLYTTVDKRVQSILEKKVYQFNGYPNMASKQHEYSIVQNTDGSTTRVIQPQAAAVITDPYTGEIRAMVGGRTAPTRMKQLNRAYQAPMPIGSSIKPLSVYAPALERGASEYSIFYNMPVKIPGWDTAQGYPSNYSGSSFTGPITMKDAVIPSYNVVAAQTLMRDVGISTSVDYLAKLGIDRSHIQSTGAGLALGVSSIHMLELAGAYDAIANGGEYFEPIAFTKITDQNNSVIIDATHIRVRRQVFSRTTSWQMADMMRSVVTSGTGKSANFNSQMFIAGKTGTNSDFRGISFAGFTPYLVGTVWIGSDAYHPLPAKTTGGGAAASLWKSFMSEIHNNSAYPNKNWVIAKTREELGIKPFDICKISGKLATTACTDVIHGAWFAPNAYPTETCDMHVFIPTCSVSGKIATTVCPEPFLKKYLLVPSDSYLRNISNSMLQKYIPGARPDLPDYRQLSQFTPADSRFASYFCTTHKGGSPLITSPGNLPQPSQSPSFTPPPTTIRDEQFLNRIRQYITAVNMAMHNYAIALSVGDIQALQLQIDVLIQDLDNTSTSTTAIMSDYRLLEKLYSNLLSKYVTIEPVAAP